MPHRKVRTKGSRGLLHATLARCEHHAVRQSRYHGWTSDVSPSPQADFPASPDDDVVMQGKTQRFAALLDLLRHLQVGIRRFGITTGVIVDHAIHYAKTLINKQIM